ncbi:MAG: hypothetical protein ACLR76_03265 [Alistipes sp.]
MGHGRRKGELYRSERRQRESQVTVSCLGYVAATYEWKSSDTTGVKLYLQRDNLVLDNVEVTAKINENSATTSGRSIERPWTICKW